MRLWSNVETMLSRMLLVFCLLWSPVVVAQEGGGILVVALEGKATLASRLDKRLLMSFDRIAAGELLLLENARLTLLYLQTGRQESYRGSGRIELGMEKSHPDGLPAPETRMLPVFVAKQIARTPLSLARGGGKAPRMRAIAPMAALTKIEQTYRRMRLEAAQGDLTPEMYRLSALFEAKAYDAVQAAVNDLEMSRNNNSEAKLLISLYRKALTNARRSG